jgi:hypothetical protein
VAHDVVIDPRHDAEPAGRESCARRWLEVNNTPVFAEFTFSHGSRRGKCDPIAVVGPATLNVMRPYRAPGHRRLGDPARRVIHFTQENIGGFDF